MATFGRTARQDVIWGELNAIRATVDAGLLDPTQGEYVPEEGGRTLEDLQDDWNDLVEEYQDAHSDNDTFG